MSNLLMTAAHMTWVGTCMASLVSCLEGGGTRIGGARTALTRDPQNAVVLLMCFLMMHKGAIWLDTAT